MIISEKKCKIILIIAIIIAIMIPHYCYAKVDAEEIPFEDNTSDSGDSGGSSGTSGTTGSSNSGSPNYDDPSYKPSVELRWKR